MWRIQMPFQAAITAAAADPPPLHCVRRVLGAARPSNRGAVAPARGAGILETSHGEVKNSERLLRHPMAALVMYASGIAGIVCADGSNEPWKPDR
jgi:hypothetical protein